MEDNVAIKVSHLSKSFKLPHDKQNSIKGGLISLIKNGKRTYETQVVLKDISFEIKKGEFFGIVGRNGSGKSTLLKTIAGIYVPSKGNVKIDGSLTPFIELGVGFNPELTGRENVFLNGALLGFNREEMTVMYDDIVEFAELERFMDQKLKNYSSGMQVRLAFSIAIRAQSDILLLDEVLAVGDAAFQQKCYNYFEQIKEEGRTVILVTHSMSIVRKYCTRAILIEKGMIAAEGDNEEVANQYKSLFGEQIDSQTLGKPQRNSKGEGVSCLTEVDYRGGQDDIIITNTLKPDKTIKNAFLGITLRDEEGNLMYWYTTENKKKTDNSINKLILSLRVQNIFPTGKYTVGVFIKSNNRKMTYLENRNSAVINIKRPPKEPRMYYPITKEIIE